MPGSDGLFRLEIRPFQGTIMLLTTIVLCAASFGIAALAVELFGLYRHHESIQFWIQIAAMLGPFLLAGYHYRITSVAVAVLIASLSGFFINGMRHFFTQLSKDSCSSSYWEHPNIEKIMNEAFCKEA